MNELNGRTFGSDYGDRVARKKGDNKHATREFGEAFDYANLRALTLGTRQVMKRGRGRITKNWFLVFNTDTRLEIK
jgi:hypothetical protein